MRNVNDPTVLEAKLEAELAEANAQVQQTLAAIEEAQADRDAMREALRLLYVAADAFNTAPRTPGHAEAFKAALLNADQLLAETAPLEIDAEDDLTNELTDTVTL